LGKRADLEAGATRGQFDGVASDDRLFGSTMVVQKLDTSPVARTRSNLRFSGTVAQAPVNAGLQVWPQLRGNAPSGIRSNARKILGVNNKMVGARAPLVRGA
jgi:hypothetical protein